MCNNNNNNTRASQEEMYSYVTVADDPSTKGKITQVVDDA